MNNWKLEHLRLTAFLLNPIEEPGEHWLSVIGVEPEAETTQRRGGVTIHVVESDLGDGAISLRVGQGGERIDWMVGRVSLLGQDDGHPIAGEIDEYRPAF